mmetsp:Transcript_31378/g.101413  ORF Transcript_31378/g.101413 Transcript_31378/m.101413 type:complete len:123 (+) Transcript_31378:63-431(+)|eukprot:scaffold2497_cov119-Isochrysis_galbana.AAC.9
MMRWTDSAADADGGAATVSQSVHPHILPDAERTDRPRMDGQEKAAHGMVVSDSGTGRLCMVQDILESWECEIQQLQRRQQEIAATFLQQQKLLSSNFNRMVEGMLATGGPPWPEADRAWNHK